MALCDDDDGGDGGLLCDDYESGDDGRGHGCGDDVQSLKIRRVRNSK